MTDVNRTLADALVSYKEEHGHPAMRALLERVAGVSAISLVPESLVGAVLAACIGGRVFGKADAPRPKPRRAKSFEELAGPAFARWNNPPPPEPEE